jgi:hypothetical protein
MCLGKKRKQRLVLPAQIVLSCFPRLVELFAMLHDDWWNCLPCCLMIVVHIKFHEFRVPSLIDLELDPLQDQF